MECLSNILVFGNKSKQVPFKLKFNNEEVSIATEYKYLGVIFSSETKDPLKKTIGQLVTKSQKALFALKSYIKNGVGRLTPALAIKMFDVQISSILGYASEVWYTGD